MDNENSSETTQPQQTTSSDSPSVTPASPPPPPPPTIQVQTVGQSDMLKSGEFSDKGSQNTIRILGVPIETKIQIPPPPPEKE